MSVSPLMSEAERDLPFRHLPRAQSLSVFRDWLIVQAEPLKDHPDPAVRNVMRAILERGPGAC